ncbi:MAG: SCO family protein [Thiothrix sp.]|nr:SCO family protein [Thiothrix sp.]HPQ94727.1 SCO family protein [Thiolinea sp.]
MKNPRKGLLYPLLLVLAFGGGIGLAWSWQTWQRSAGTENAVVVSGRGGDFELESGTGSFGLADLRGKVVLLYFGFTSCPDVCPTTLGNLRAAFERLTPQEQTQVQGLFISIDPERDTPEKADAYAHFFHAGLRGLSGTPEQIAKVAVQYGVLYRKVETPDSALNYAMDHSSVIYVIDRQGHLQQKLQHGETPDEIVAAIRRYLGQGG